MDKKKTGLYIRKRRLERGYSQEKLAELLGVQSQAISKWERGAGMPGYENVDKLCAIFSCSLTDILEPQIEESGENTAEKIKEEEPEISSLPVMYEILRNEDSFDNRKKRFSFFDFFSKRKMCSIIGRVFGVEYEEIYTRKFMFKDCTRKRSTKEYEDTLTQGMFSDDDNHTVLGLESPWLWFRALIFLLGCTLLSFAATVLSDNPASFIFVGGLCAAVPLLLFLFESNFTRDISVFSLAKYALIGGVASVFLAIFNSLNFTYDFAHIAIWAPIAEECAKAFVLTLIFVKAKPKNMLSGLLIGFAVGMGFDLIENYQYGIEMYLLGSVEDLVYESYGMVGTGSISAMATIVIRVLSSFVTGHHFYTGIFGGLYVLFCGERASHLLYKIPSKAFGKTLLALLYCVLLHGMWNASAFISVTFFSIWLRILVAFLSVFTLVALVNVGIAEAKLSEIYEIKKSKETEEWEKPAEFEKEETAAESGKTSVAEDTE